MTTGNIKEYSGNWYLSSRFDFSKLTKTVSPGDRSESITKFSNNNEFMDENFEDDDDFKKSKNNLEDYDE